MRIKTITCHDVYNLGASLQAYALQAYLQGLGHEVEIIDYKPDYLSGHYKMWSVSGKYDKPIIRWLYLIAKLPSRLRALKRKKVFDEFREKYLHLTSQRYHSNEELKQNPPEADVYIAGSDQIWNTLFLNGRDAAFYLDFAPVTKKRISYAASFATKEVVPEYREFVSRELMNFDAVSIRENNSLSLLKSLGAENGVAVCDPVFLLDKVKWMSLVKGEDLKVSNERYFLVYLTDKSNEVKNISHYIQKKTGWKIYVIGNFREAWADKNFVNAGPLDFVKLVCMAQYVISNSFHATAFSLIFEKKFCVVNRKEGINERMKSILDDFGLSNHIVDEFNDSILRDIDYKKVLPSIENLISFSKDWLSKAIEYDK